MQLQATERVERSVAVEIDAIEAFNVIRANICRAMGFKPEWQLDNLGDGYKFYWNLPQEPQSYAAPATPEQVNVWKQLAEMQALIFKLGIK